MRQPSDCHAGKIISNEHLHRIGENGAANMYANKIITLLDKVKSNKGLSRKEVEDICGKETSFIIALLRKYDACLICDNDRISMVKDGNAAILIEELLERKKEKKRDNIRWIVTTTISVIALLLSIFSVLRPFF